MVVFDRWMENQLTEGGWGKQPRHLTINQGRQLWVLHKTDCSKMDEAREKKRGGMTRRRWEREGVGGEWWVGMAEERCSKLVEGNQRKWFIH